MEACSDGRAYTVPLGNRPILSFHRFSALLPRGKPASQISRRADKHHRGGPDDRYFSLLPLPSHDELPRCSFVMPAHPLVVLHGVRKANR